MRTTVDIPDALLREAKRYAAAHGLTLGEVVASGLRLVIDEKPFKLKDGSVLGNGMVKDFTWDEIMEICYEGRGGSIPTPDS